MSKRIEMNYKMEDGTYEVLYPNVLAESVSITTNYGNDLVNIINGIGSRVDWAENNISGIQGQIGNYKSEVIGDWTLTDTTQLLFTFTDDFQWQFMIVQTFQEPATVYGQSVFLSTQNPATASSGIDIVPKIGCSVFFRNQTVVVSYAGPYVGGRGFSIQAYYNNSFTFAYNSLYGAIASSRLGLSSYPIRIIGVNIY